MPYKSEKINIQGTENDRRIKLTADDKELIKWLREEEQISYQKLANQFNVSKRTIIFICKPETLEACKKKREERGGWKQYYEKEKNSQSVKETRNYKQKLYLDGKINFDKPNSKPNE
jgi:DNA-binding XRE family transcriptional regulator